MKKLRFKPFCIGFLFTLILVILIMVIISCGNFESKADDEQRQETENMMLEAHRQTGMPNIINFQQKKLMKMIYELCDKEDLVCYAYMFSDYQGKLIALLFL